MSCWPIRSHNYLHDVTRTFDANSIHFLPPKSWQICKEKPRALKRVAKGASRLTPLALVLSIRALHFWGCACHPVCRVRLDKRLLKTGGVPLCRTLYTTLFSTVCKHSEQRSTQCRNLNTNRKFTVQHKLS